MEYTKPNLYRTGSLRLTPGLNEVHKETWDEVKENPYVKKMVADGVILLKDYKGKTIPKAPSAIAKENNNPVKQAPAFEGYVLEDMSIKDAKKMVIEMLDFVTLQKWEGLEKRKEILKAIAAQKKAVLPAKKDDDNE